MDKKLLPPAVCIVVLGGECDVTMSTSDITDVEMIVLLIHGQGRGGKGQGGKGQGRAGGKDSRRKGAVEEGPKGSYGALHSLRLSVWEHGLGVVDRYLRPISGPRSRSRSSVLS